jgi:predicted GNAT family acetyltransferase
MLVSYQTPQQYLDATLSMLHQRELENNLIIGVCNGFADTTQPQPNCVFINVFDDDEIKATSIKTLAKAIVASNTQDTVYLKELADYYIQENIDLKGAIGEHACTAAFSDYYGKPYITEMELIIHQLTSVTNLPISEGRFEMADMTDFDAISKLAYTFEEEKKPASRASMEHVYQLTQSRIAAGDIFKWMHQGQMVSVAGIVRKTANAGIIGLVYTPTEYRCKGYATSIVSMLSLHILQNGFKYCGLFTDKANATSNHIYKKIGYEPILEFTDLAYL